jgi:hypothetical protein
MASRGLPHRRVDCLARTRSQLALAPGEGVGGRLRRIGLGVQVLLGLLQLAPSLFQRLVRSRERLLSIRRT